MANAPTKFAGLKGLRDRKDTAPETPPAPAPVAPEPDDDLAPMKLTARDRALLEANALQTDHIKHLQKELDAKRGRGRPRGKRSNEDYVSTSILIPAELRDNVQNTLRTAKRLHDKPHQKAPDLSDLVAELLTNWLIETQTKR